MSPIRVVPANEAGCEDLDTVFGTRGAAAGCRCQRFKLWPRESFASFPVEERAHRMREQTDCGHPRSSTSPGEASTTSGLVAYLDGDPVGWCAVEPRTAYRGLNRNNRVPWVDRDEVKADDSVWAVTCVLARARFRRRGVGTALVRATIPFARERGARALEGYPLATTNAISEELSVGTRSMFASAGFAEVSHPTPRRLVMRIEF